MVPRRGRAQCERTTARFTSPAAKSACCRGTGPCCAGRRGCSRRCSCCPGFDATCRRRASLSSGRKCSPRWRLPASLDAPSGRHVFRRRCRSSRPERSRSRRPCSHFARVSSPRITAPSTSRSERTSTVSARRRSTSAVAHTSSGRCCWRRPPARRLPDAHRRISAGLRASWLRLARWRPRRRSLAGWCVTRSIRLRRRSPARATSCRSGVATAEPTADQVDVADAALNACLELERET